MRVAFAVIVLAIVCLLATACSAQGPSGVQSVSGEFARDWINSYKAQNPQPVQVNRSTNGNDLWNWGKAPKGSAIVDGKLLTDPNYLRPWLNLSSNWLGETYTDPNTGLSVNTYLDPLTGKTIYKYINPSTGRAYYTYSSYIDPNTGKRVYAYLNPYTGEPVSTAVSPAEMTNTLQNPQTGDELPRTFDTF
jgi:hypothetical protein